VTSPDGRRTHASSPAQAQRIARAVDERITDEADSDVHNVHASVLLGRSRALSVAPWSDKV